MKSLKLNNKGFTFLEVMVALMVLAMVITSVFRLYTQSISMLISSGFDLKAPLLAKSIACEKSIEESLPEKDKGKFKEKFPDYSWELLTSEIKTDKLKGDFPENIKTLKFKKVEIIVKNKEKRKYITFFHGKELD